MKSRHLLAGLVVALALPAVAQAGTPGFYVGAAVGANLAPDAKAADGTNSANVLYDPGGAGFVNLGYAFSNGLRTELEGGYRSNTVDRVRRNSFPTVGNDGETKTWSLMTNLLYDVGTGTPFTPYVGGGIGVGSTTARLANSNFGTAVYDGSDTQFAFQGIVGAAYGLTQNLSLTADYRYMATTNPTINADAAPVTLDTGNHTITAGVRWSFGGQSAPTTELPVSQPSYVAEAPPPAPVVPTDYLVFFDWNQTSITRDARQIISDAASAAGRRKPVTIEVTGHTDTSGTLRYNQALSERRAEAVKNELVMRGVDPKRIHTVGKADNDLMVNTPKGVREPSNRRAQIVLHIG